MSYLAFPARKQRTTRGGDGERERCASQFRPSGVSHIHHHIIFLPTRPLEKNLQHEPRRPQYVGGTGGRPLFQQGICISKSDRVCNSAWKLDIGTAKRYAASSHSRYRNLPCPQCSRLQYSYFTSPPNLSKSLTRWCRYPPQCSLQLGCPTTPWNGQTRRRQRQSGRPAPLRRMCSDPGRAASPVISP